MLSSAQFYRAASLGDLADGRQKHRRAERHWHLGALSGGPQPVEGMIIDVPLKAKLYRIDPGVKVFRCKVCPCAITAVALDS